MHLFQGKAGTRKSGHARGMCSWDKSEETQVKSRITSRNTILHHMSGPGSALSSLDSTHIRHRDRETPFRLYHGIKFHGDARFKHQINSAHHLGLSVSYDHVMEVKAQLSRAVCKRHAEDGYCSIHKYKTFSFHYT